MSLASLTPALWLLVPVAAFLLLQVLKAVIAPLDHAPALVKQIVATVFAFAGSLVAAHTGVPIPADLASVDAGTIERLLTWALTVLLGGSATVGLHAIKKATVG
jgi:hypothetical protein